MMTELLMDKEMLLYLNSGAGACLRKRRDVVFS